MTRTTTTALLLTATFALATPAFAQAPSEAQREAIKSSCRSDYIAHCSSIPPGGAASLECLQKNMSSLSASCASAVRAVEAPAAAPKTAEEPKAEPKPEKAEEPRTEPKAEPKSEAKETKSAAEPKAASAAKKPSQAQISAIRSACRGDYPKVCAGVPTGGAPALECLEKNKAKVSAACAKAVAAVGGGGGGAPAAAAGGTSGGGAPAAAAAPAAPEVIVLRPMRPREALFVVRSACGADVARLCGGVPLGGGRVVQCLASQAGALSPACKDVLGQFAQ
jgi:outer membrane biosynthesis protein TonB